VQRFWTLRLVRQHAPQLSGSATDRLFAQSAAFRKHAKCFLLARPHPKRPLGAGRFWLPSALATSSTMPFTSHHNSVRQPRMNWTGSTRSTSRAYSSLRRSFSRSSTMAGESLIVSSGFGLNLKTKSLTSQVNAVVLNEWIQLTNGEANPEVVRKRGSRRSLVTSSKRTRASPRFSLVLFRCISGVDPNSQR